ncbi:MAG: acyl-CoA dehydrogenase [Candidatus Thermoplasmatota archaeon]|nr:acyl-CoA dehydrogenase [Candidatus Thermoplasmatota archaeon]MDI6855894.1 acyl-CoA dehydrogenase [Candidatus Thermoplasmatota archaeon]
MDLKLTEEQELIKKTVRDFAAKEIAPVAQEIDKERRYPAEIINKLSKLGLMGITIPSEDCGAGLDTVSYTIAIEELSKASAAVGAIVAVHHLACEVIRKFGTREQKRKYLANLASGKYLGAFALTEPNAGSDASAIEMSAKLEGNEYVLNGKKLFIVNGAQASVVNVFAKTDATKGAKGISAFIVEKDFHGFSVGKTIGKLGIRGCEITELLFENCKVPKENLIGQENEGFKIALASLDSGRIGIASQALGIAQAAFEEALKYSKQRKQFGKFICEFQAIQWMLANMATEIEAARLLVYKAALAKDRNEKFTLEASMAKLFASEVAVRTAIKAVQIHGGYGYTKDYPVERYFRDSKITEIYEGTNEIQRLIIASQLLGRRTI